MRHVKREELQRWKEELEKEISVKGDGIDIVLTEINKILLDGKTSIIVGNQYVINKEAYGYPIIEVQSAEPIMTSDGKETILVFGVFVSNTTHFKAGETIKCYYENLREVMV